MKKVLSVLLILALTFALAGCGSYGTELDTEALRGEYNQDLAGTELNVFNWGTYISDGSEGSLDVNAAFEELTGIKVNYTNYESNEAMYSKMKGGAVSYDIIIPSDYMIQRMNSEGMIQPLDYSRITNYDLIDPQYKGLYFDENEEYTVPYMCCLTGLIYNTSMVEETPDSWSIMWDEKYAGDILTFNNSRDAFSIAQMVLGQDVNTTDKADWDAAAELLKQQNPVLQARVMDEVFNKMEGGNAALAPYYSGDFLIMVENNPDLAMVYPKEGTIYAVDSICVPSNANNYDAAMMYINFLLEPQVALANAEYIGYVTPNMEVVNDPDYCYYQNEYLYPEEMPKLYSFTDLPTDVRDYYEKLWEEVLLD